MPHTLRTGLESSNQPDGIFLNRWFPPEGQDNQISNFQLANAGDFVYS
jgi:hypothetical protein